MSQALARKLEPALIEGEFVFTQADFEHIARLLYAEAGIVLSDTKAALVYSRLAKRVRTLGLTSFADYRLRLETADERRVMLNALTTNLTRFFREPHHFDHLRESVLAPAAAAVAAGARLRLWSAGCSTGQEPWSLALTVLSAIPKAAELDVKILATDIDTNVLAQGAAGAYADDQIDAIPPAMRQWLARDEADPNRWRMGRQARALVSFKPLNLIADWPIGGPFAAIFCRNVVIYFDEPTQERIWSRMRPLLGADGRLFIGHSERLGAAASGYVTDGLTSYRVRPEGARS